jgi:hypothetical protein
MQTVGISKFDSSYLQAKCFGKSRLRRGFSRDLGQLITNRTRIASRRVATRVLTLRLIARCINEATRPFDLMAHALYSPQSRLKADRQRPSLQDAARL